MDTILPLNTRSRLVPRTGSGLALSALVSSPEKSAPWETSSTTPRKEKDGCCGVTTMPPFFVRLRATWHTSSVLFKAIVVLFCVATTAVGMLLGTIAWDGITGRGYSQSSFSKTSREELVHSGVATALLNRDNVGHLLQEPSPVLGICDPRLPLSCEGAIDSGFPSLAIPGFIDAAHGTRLLELMRQIGGLRTLILHGAQPSLLSSWVPSVLRGALPGVAVHVVVYGNGGFTRESARPGDTDSPAALRVLASLAQLGRVRRLAVPHAGPQHDELTSAPVVSAAAGAVSGVDVEALPFLAARGLSSPAQPHIRSLGLFDGRSHVLVLAPYPHTPAQAKEGGAALTAAIRAACGLQDTVVHTPWLPPGVSAAAAGRGCSAPLAITGHLDLPGLEKLVSDVDSVVFAGADSPHSWGWAAAVALMAWGAGVPAVLPPGPASRALLRDDRSLADLLLLLPPEATGAAASKGGAAAPSSESFASRLSAVLSRRDDLAPRVRAYADYLHRAGGAQWHEFAGVRPEEAGADGALEHPSATSSGGGAGGLGDGAYVPAAPRGVAPPAAGAAGVSARPHVAFLTRELMPVTQGAGGALVSGLVLDLLSSGHRVTVVADAPCGDLAGWDVEMLALANVTGAVNGGEGDSGGGDDLNGGFGSAAFDAADALEAKGAAGDSSAAGGSGGDASSHAEGALSLETLGAQSRKRARAALGGVSHAAAGPGSDQLAVLCMSQLVAPSSGSASPPSGGSEAGIAPMGEEALAPAGGSDDAPAFELVAAAFARAAVAAHASRPFDVVEVFDAGAQGIALLEARERAHAAAGGPPSVGGGDDAHRDGGAPGGATHQQARAFLPALPPHVRIVVRAHGTASMVDLADSAPARGWEEKQALYAAERRALELADAVLVPTAAVARMYVRAHSLWPASVLVAPPPMARLLAPAQGGPGGTAEDGGAPLPASDEDVELPDDSAGGAQQPGGGSARAPPPLILVLGKLQGAKGTETVARALGLLFAELDDRGPRVRVMFVGADAGCEVHGRPMGDCVRGHVSGEFSEAVTVVDPVPHAQLPAFLRRLRASRGLVGAVVASTYDTFNLAAHELARAGVPLVLSDIPAFADHWPGTDSAFRFAHDDPESLMQALLALLTDEGKRTRLRLRTQLEYGDPVEPYNRLVAR